jgi:hypothetical protein
MVFDFNKSREPQKELYVFYDHNIYIMSDSKAQRHPTYLQMMKQEHIRVSQSSIAISLPTSFSNFIGITRVGLERNGLHFSPY